MFNRLRNKLEGTEADRLGSTTHTRPRLVYGVTVGVSAFALMRGQLGWFAERGWDVILACNPDNEARLTVEREKVRFHGIPTHRDISIAADLVALCSWLKFLKQVKPDAINVGTPKAGLLGGLSAWLLRVPKRIYVVRGLRLEGTKGPMLAILWLMERLSSALATDVIVVSDSLAKELLNRRLVNPEKSWIIGKGSSNGVDAETISRRTSEVDASLVRYEHGIDSDVTTVGFVGRVAKDKGVDTLISAMASGLLDAKVHLVIIGAVEDTDLARQLEPLGERVHVLPWTSDLWGLLPLIDILCLPTRREGFPNVVLEAASAAIPTVTTRATGAVDSVIEGETGYVVDIDDTPSLAHAINRLANDAALRERMGSAARARAMEDFNPELVWSGLESVVLGDYQASGLSRLSELTFHAVARNEGIGG